MPKIRYTLCSEGPSDRVLLRHIEWALERLTESSFSGEWADPSVYANQARDVQSRILQAMSYYPCNLLFVHRDADNQGYAHRKAEIVDALHRAGVAIPAVSVIPVRMTESWLLCDEAAIRRASGRPNGTAPLPIPPIDRLERDADPKRTLEECLSLASEKAGRKLETFKRSIPSLRYRVAELVDDFSCLSGVPAFDGFMADLAATLTDTALAVE